MKKAMKAARKGGWRRNAVFRYRLISICFVWGGGGLKPSWRMPAQAFALPGFYVVAVSGGVLKTILLPGIERLLRRHRTANEGGNLFVVIVVHKREPRRPSKIHVYGLGGIGIDLSYILTSAKLAWALVGLIQIR